MRCRTRSLLTASTLITNICLSRWSKIARLSGRKTISSRLGRAGRSVRFTELVFRRVRRLPPAQPPKVIRNTTYQTVVHLRQMTQRHIHRHITAESFLRQDAFLLVLPRLEGRRPGEDMDPARPTRAAHLLLRIFSKESARRELRPFYNDVVRGVLREEQERYKSRPTRAISLIWNLFGRPNAFRTLTRFYLGAVEKLGSNYFPALTGPNALYLAAGVVMHSRIYQRYIQHLWREGGGVPVRYAMGESAVAEDLLRLPAARRAILPPRDALERLADASGQENSRPASPAPPAPGREVHLSEADFRALVRGVTDTLNRQARLETLQRGGM